MTDPFKNQRYSYNYPTFNHENSIQDQPLSFNQPFSGHESMKKVTLSEENDRNSNLVHQDAFIQAHIQANKDLIKQLKSNIELLFKGTLIAGGIIFFPFSALRWQCQGFYTLWKGSFSMAAYNGFKLVSESILSELTSFEKNIEEVTKPNKIYGHALLKLISISITTPIFSAVIYESVQSGISHQNIGLLDLMKETWNRIIGYKYNYRTRLIPFWYLLAPTAFYFIGLHFLSYGLEKFTLSTINFTKKIFKDKRKSSYSIDEVELEVIETPYINAMSQLISRITAIVLLYPVETTLNRLIVQGTRTIIDNTDNGFGVIPINTRYDGFYDCVQSIYETEGVFGFYKGFGSLILETGFYLALLKLSKEIATRIFDSEWTTRTDLNNIKNLMSSSSLTLTKQNSLYDNSNLTRNNQLQS